MTDQTPYGLSWRRPRNFEELDEALKEVGKQPPIVIPLVPDLPPHTRPLGFTVKMV